MKKLLSLMAIIACSACSSTPKETTVSSDIPNTPAVEKKADTTMNDKMNMAKDDMGKAGKKAHKKMKEAAAKAEADVKEATDKTASSSSDFGTINGTEKSSVTCTNKGDTRKISILNVTEGGCGVVYNKAGADKTVAVAKTGGDYCDTVSNKIKTNLEGAGFDCGGGAAAATDKAAAPTAKAAAPAADAQKKQ